MPKLHYPIYDTALFGDSAGVTHTLFQQGQGSASTKGFTITNARGSGQFPERESFTIERIAFHVDDISLSDDDIIGLFTGSILTLEYNNVKVLQAPLYMFSDLNASSGIKTEASASAFDYFGQYGSGFTMKIPLMIQGGKNFKVEIYQALALDTASQDMKLTLDGVLDTPDITVN